MSSEFEVKPQKLYYISGQFSSYGGTINNLVNEMQGVYNWLNKSDYNKVRNNLRALMDYERRYSKSMNSMGDAIEGIVRSYDSTEKDILNNAGVSSGIMQKITDAIKNGMSAVVMMTMPIYPGGLILVDWLSFVGLEKYLPNIHKEFEKSGTTTGLSGIIGNEENGGYAKGDLGYADGSVHSEFELSENGIIASAGLAGDVAALQGEVGYNAKYGSVSASGAVLAASGEAEAKFNVTDTGIDVGAKAEAGVAVVKGEASGQLGLDDYNVHGEVEGSALSAEAKAEAGIVVNENGTATLKAEAGAEAYLVKGEAKGGFTFMGIEVDLGIEGGIGVNATAGGEVSTSGVAFDVGLGPIAGEVSIDWSDFKWPEIEIPKIDFPSVDWGGWF